jgi:hypothetical protein
VIDSKICSRCIYDHSIPDIAFDENGICSYCNLLDDIQRTYGTAGEKGQFLFENVLTEIKQKGKGNKYDCIIGVSGGTDSSYLLYASVKLWGLRPLAVHFDNTWNSSIASMNIYRVLNSLNIDLYTHVVSNKEMDDIYKSFFFAGVPELEASVDLGYAYLLRKIAQKFRVKFILEGHSFLEEGITPLGKNYFDGRYIKSIHKKYGIVNLKTYPLMTFSRFVRSILFFSPRFIRPLWYVKYTKIEARKILTQEFDWQYYGGHHLENLMASFLHRVYLPQKFHIDLRLNEISAMVRTGQITREKGLALFNDPTADSRILVEYVTKRLGLDLGKYEEIMNAEPKYWQSFPTYKRYFEFFGAFFLLMAKFNRVPMSFYIKYCKRPIN